MHNNGINITHDLIRIGDYNVRPFNTNKTWKFTSDDVKNFQVEETEIVDINWGLFSSKFIEAYQLWITNLGTTSITVMRGSNYSNIDPNIINVFRYFYPENDKYFGNILNVSSSLYENTYTLQPLDPKLLWYYLDHNYYRDYRKDKNPADETDFDINNHLAPTGSIIIFPKSMTGESIKKGSFKIKNINPGNNSYEYNVIDDGIGNIIDTTIDETKIIDHKYNLLYVGFNEKYREENFVNTKLDYVLDWSNHLNEINIINKRKIYYTKGITTSDTNESTGICANFSGSYLEVTNNELFNFSNNINFAFSFWIKIPENQSIENVSFNPIFDKKTVNPIDVYRSNTGTFTINTLYETKDQYPFDIFLNNSTSIYPNTIQFRQSDGNKIIDIKSEPLIPNIWHHIVCQKSGSTYQIWSDGVLDDFQTENTIVNVQNKSKFFIAGNGNSNYFSGSLDEIRIFSKSLTQSEIENLADNSLKYGYAYQRKEIGNIFYHTGVVVVSDPRPKYKTAFLGRNGVFDYENIDFGFEGEFKSINTLYENEVICTIEKNKLNFTQNPSSLIRYNNELKIKPYVINSFFTPYITTIGLYNDNHDLVAVAKLATPLKKRKDIDVNVIIRFDM